MPSDATPPEPIEILLVEDSPSDAFLIQHTLSREFSDRVHMVDNGVDAVAYLRRQGTYAFEPRPDLILLDLNLPQKDGREVLLEIKSEKKLWSIPVVVFTSSAAEEDVRTCYDLHANCYVTKPVDFDRLAEVLRTIRDFWSRVATLPWENHRGPEC